MKVIFVYRLPAGYKRNSVIDSQAEALEKIGVEIIRFAITEGGIKGYIKSIVKLYTFYRKNSYDVVHAHYFQSALAATLACPKKIVVSLMGSDVNEAGKTQLRFIRFLSRFAWDQTIVKSAEMQEKVPGAIILPNGVDFVQFRPIDKEKCLEIVALNPSFKNLIFVAEDILSPNKNYELAVNAVKQTGRKDIKLVPVTKVHQSQLVYFYNAADALLFTSKKEGSPNVIKEAMACNCPIISTPVGDVPDILKHSTGTFVVIPDAALIAEKIELILSNGTRTNGRENLKQLDSNVISERLIMEYESVISKVKS
ncbi:MAG: glycosyltransferase family 4 protein [Lentimicrobium sp.]